MNLSEDNAQLYDEYLRITGSDSRFRYVMWYAQQYRACVRALSSDPIIAGRVWGALSKSGQHARLVRFLRAQPAAGAAA